MAKLNYTDAQLESLLYKIHTGHTTPRVLPKDLYLAIAAYLKSGLYAGFGSSKFGFGKPDEKLLAEFRTNIYMFSAAKTFQQVKEMSEAMIDGNHIRPFSEFKTAADEIFDRYNKAYLRTEYDTAKGMAQVGKKWQKIVEQKEIFPMVRYVAVLSGNTCEICESLNGITLPVDDEFWDDYAPLNHFNCLCILEQLTEEEAGESSDAKVERAEEAVDPLMDDTFKMNPGKEEVVFKTDGDGKHPYFDVQERYKDLAKNNFNMPIPPTDDAE